MQDTDAKSSPPPARHARRLPSVVREALPAAVLIALVVAATAWVLPGRSRNPLAETTVWSLLILTSFVGWGSLVRFVVAARERVDAGLRAAWGAGLVCFLGGALMVPSLMTRATALLLVDAGVVFAIVALVRERAAVRLRARFVGRFLRREPALSFVGLVVGCVVAVHCLGGIADWHTNPYDDDIAYLAFLKKLSDTGTILEPFSFRRLSAYGGQTLFLELVSVRAAPSQAHTFDRCISVLLIVMLMLGHRRRGRRPAVLFLLSTILLVVAMPTIAINTASYFSGVVFFLALFRTLVWVEERTSERSDVARLAPWKAALPLALVAVAACTLRQNYLPVPAVTLAVSYGARIFRTRGALRVRLAEPFYAAGFSLAALVPWFIVSWQSNHTFLYPVMPGTFHTPLALNATGWNVVREIAFQGNVAVEGLPLETFGLFVVAAAFVREPGARVPLGATCVAAIVGFVALVHGLTQSDATNIGRYAFAFLVAMALAVVLTTSTARLSARPGRLHVAAGLALFATFLQIALSRDKFWKEYGLKFDNVELLAYSRSRATATEPPELRMYAERLQGAVPAGERIAVLVDEPHYLDFRRNPIWNLDMPGYASLPPGMPSFKGSEALEEYYRALGLRWLMWVTPEHSRYHYRRGYFLELFLSEQEIWRAYAPYLVDFIDNLAEIRRRHREVYSERGIVVIDLAEPHAEEAPKDGASPTGDTSPASDPQSADAGARASDTDSQAADAGGKPDVAVGARASASDAGADASVAGVAPGEEEAR
ncbi:MAG: hypothetical protein KF850_36330 [Labilithrix sp.]|nr:hypothetical protein [Labilithrix sp.]